MSVLQSENVRDNACSRSRSSLCSLRNQFHHEGRRGGAVEWVCAPLALPVFFSFGLGYSYRIVQGAKSNLIIVTRKSWNPCSQRHWQSQWHTRNTPDSATPPDELQGRSRSRDGRDRRIPCFVLFASFVVNLSGQTILRTGSAHCRRKAGRKQDNHEGREEHEGEESGVERALVQRLVL